MAVTAQEPCRYEAGKLDSFVAVDNKTWTLAGTRLAAAVRGSFLNRLWMVMMKCLLIHHVSEYVTGKVLGRQEL